MKRLFLLFVTVFFSLIINAQTRPNDAYLAEDNGYFINVKPALNGYVFTDNYCNSLYYLENGELSKLISAPGCGRYYTVSPDKTKLGFKLISKTGQTPAYILLEDKSLHSLANESLICGQVGFTDNSIYYTKDQWLYLLLNDDSTLRENLGNYSNIVAVSNNNQQFVFSSENDELVLFDTQTLQKTIISEYGKMSVYPQFSPDGKKVLYQSGEMYVFEIETGLTYNVGNGIGPKWSPDSETIVFTKSQIQEYSLIASDIYISNYKTGTHVKITDTPSILEMQPSFISENEIVYDTYSARGIYKSNILNNTTELIYQHEEELEISHFDIANQTKSVYVVPGTVPYTHQVYDTPDNHYGYGSCAPACAIMAISYYNRLPQWPTTVTKLYSHTSLYGAYVSKRYRLNEHYFEESSQPSGGGSLAYGGYGYMWGLGSPNSQMKNYMQLHYMTSSQLWTSSVTWASVIAEINADYPLPVCAMLTSSGHLVLAKGYINNQHTLLFSDPYGNKNTPNYPSYDGQDAYYDWPGYNNGYQNLDYNGSYGNIAWTVTAHTNEVSYNETIIDDVYYNHGFHINNSQDGSDQRYFRDINGGYNGHFWYTITEASLNDIAWVEWSPTTVNVGYYNISVHIPATYANAQNARYQITDADGLHIVEINQGDYTDEWVNLGNYRCDNNGEFKVRLGDGTGIAGENIAFDAMKFDYIASNPTTEISIARKWYNSKFQASFTDNENMGGISFYQIMDYDGTEWRANGNNGFFNDNFSNGINTEWTDVSGNWSVNAGQLLQTDEITENSNIYANLTQESGEIYLYHWGLKILGESQTRRAGIHFFCSEPTGEGRGNSYLVYLRADDNSIQICRYYDNLYDSPNSWHTFTDFTINTDQFYDVKVILNTISGEISVYINDVIAASEIDPTPLTSGSAISLRTGTSQAVYDNIKVYKARENIIDVIPGLSPNADIRYQSSTASEEAGRIRTVLVNNSNNWSESVSENIFTDFDVPITTIATENNNDWQTTDFTANFTDTDDLSGIEKSMYCVSDYDGGKWTANPEKGFVYTDFDSEIGTEWSSQVGTWTNSAGALVQTDETNGNTNIYSYIQHDLSNRYLYEFDLRIDGTNTDKRGGFHFFADDPTLTNRGNGYFIWFRLITQKLEFYKVEDNIFSLEKTYDVEFNENQWYNIKLIFDRINGDTFAYMDNMLVGEYKDAAPYLSGNYISFRSGNSIMSVDNLRVYRTRYPDVDISIGNALADIRYESISPEIQAARIYSIVHDSAKNISAIATLNQKVDWTPPPVITTVNDGIGSDINYTSVLGEISANWTAVNDENSGILAYYYAVGTSPGATDFIPWTNNGTNLNFTDASVTLTVGTTYYVSVKAENGAGLFSELTTSDGRLATLSVECPEDYSVCINDNPVTLEGSSPIGGVYSGLGVTDGIFNPQTANEGTHTITYTYQTEICQFNITVNELPVVLCPEDITVTEADSPVALQGGTPEGGEYSIDGVPVSYINPANYDFGEYEIIYSYTDEITTCSAYCVYHLTVTPFVNTAIFEQSNFVIYPNPSNGDFTLIIANNQKNIIAEIVNLQGQILYSKKIYPNTDKVEFNGLNMNSGIYLLKLSSNEKVIIEKIIIQI